MVLQVRLLHRLAYQMRRVVCGGLCVFSLFPGALQGENDKKHTITASATRGGAPAAGAGGVSECMHLSTHAINNVGRFGYFVVCVRAASMYSSEHSVQQPTQTPCAPPRPSPPVPSPSLLQRPSTTQRILHGPLPGATGRPQPSLPSELSRDARTRATGPRAIRETRVTGATRATCTARAPNTLFRSEQRGSMGAAGLARTSGRSGLRTVARGEGGSR